MHKLDLAMSHLRLLLADVAAKQEGLAAQRRQFVEQQDRIVRYAVYEDANVERALSMMLEIDGRLEGVERAAKHLEAIRQKAQRELDSLVLTKLVEQTRARLSALRAQLAEGGAAPGAPEGTDGEAGEAPADPAWLAAEIRRLEAIIAAASGAAAKSLG